MFNCSLVPTTKPRGGYKVFETICDYAFVGSSLSSFGEERERTSHAINRSSVKSIIQNHPGPVSCSDCGKRNELNLAKAEMGSLNQKRITSAKPGAGLWNRIWQRLCRVGARRRFM